MLNLYLQCKNSNEESFTKENVSAFIFSLLSSAYHDTGLNTYFNGSGVKAHSFYVDNYKPQCNEIIQLTIKGIPPLLNSVREKLEKGSTVRLGYYNFILFDFEDVNFTFKKYYKTATPFIIRNKDLISDTTSITNRLENSLKRKYELIYGEELVGLHGIYLHDLKHTKEPLIIHTKEVMHVGFTGVVELDATDECIEFILSVGLGNRTTYGYGNLI